MGDRYELELKCPYCGTADEVWYAPTCGSDTHTCSNCKKGYFITSDMEPKKLEDLTLEDVIDGFESATSVSWKEGEIERMCKERLEELKKVVGE